MNTHIVLDISNIIRIRGIWSAIPFRLIGSFFISSFFSGIFLVLFNQMLASLYGSLD